MLAPAEFSESFEKSHTTVDLDKITKVGVLTQTSTNNSVNKIMFYEDDCITFIATAYGYSVSEPNLLGAKGKSNKFYQYKEYPKPAGKVIVGFKYNKGSYGKNDTLVDFEPLYWHL